MTPSRFVTGIAIAIVACSFMVIGVYVLTIGLDKIVPQSIRFILTCALSYSLIRGWEPGRWMTIILLGLAGVFSLTSGVIYIVSSSSGLGLIFLGAVYTFCVIGLLSPYAQKHFQMSETTEQAKKESLADSNSEKWKESWSVAVKHYAELDGEQMDSMSELATALLQSKHMEGLFAITSMAQLRISLYSTYPEWCAGRHIVIDPAESGVNVRYFRNAKDPKPIENHCEYDNATEVIANLCRDKL
jgi:hypothetical protein